MSDNRKVLTAKRKNERDKDSYPSKNKTQEGKGVKQGFKRPLKDNGKKNPANDRLKRLRSVLNEEVKNTYQRKVNTHIVNKPSGDNVHKPHKRSNISPTQAVAVKMSKQEIEKSQSAFILAEEKVTQRNIFTAVTPEAFKVSNQVQDTSDSVEAMEWDPTEDIPSTFSASTSTTGIECSVNTNISKWDVYLKNFFIIVDTNIFLQHLNLIKDIITMKITGDGEPVIIIPWIVIEELDFLKDDTHKTYLKNKAQEAVKYIESTLKNKHVRMRGQTLVEVNEQKNLGKVQDNKILACCLQVKEKYKDMILLTGDINLRNKAHINNIPVCTHNEIKSKITQTLNRNLKQASKTQRILDKMTSLCIVVIRECAKNAYGEASNKMPICQKSPKTLEDCITLFVKYWFPVFQEHLMKQFKKSVEDLSLFLKTNAVIKDDAKELIELVRLCVRMCLFLKDVECCKDMIEETIRYLNDIRDS